MAIIRKGDKEAEEKLADRAKEQKREKKAVPSRMEGRTANNGLKPDRTRVSVDKTTGKPVAKQLQTKQNGELVRRIVTGPVKGSDVAKARAAKKEYLSRNGSGIIQSGKVVKASEGSVAKLVAKSQAKRKKTGK